MPSVTHLLDTHTWIWFFNQDERARKLSTLLPQDASLGISIITIWEAAMLEVKGRVRFHPDLDSRVREMSARQLCTLLPLSPTAASASARLAMFHGDPANRMIVATAIETGATLVTADGKILAWAAANDQLAVLAL